MGMIYSLGGKGGEGPAAVPVRRRSRMSRLARTPVRVLAAKVMVKLLASTILSSRTRSLVTFDVRRFEARLRSRSLRAPSADQLHFGCGSRRVAGFVNVDISKGDFVLDLSAGRLPWPAGAFKAAVGQHVIEHLELDDELIPFLTELRRVCAPGAELWLSTPDLEKVCRGYLQDHGAALLHDRSHRWPRDVFEGPSQQVINYIFHQRGEHKNLFDFELLEWTLHRSGWKEVERVSEADLLARFPAFPPRADDFQSIYVRAR